MSGQTLTTLLYGAIVNQLLEQEQDPEKTTQILHSFGLEIGARLVDDFVSKGPVACQTFEEMAEGVSNALQYYLECKGSTQVVSKDALQFQIKMSQNPLEQFVKVPAQLKKLCYCQIICGAVVGALRQLQQETEATYLDGMLTVKLLHTIETKFQGQ